MLLSVAAEQPHIKKPLSEGGFIRNYDHRITPG